MREMIARATCVFALVLVVALSFAFAVRHNPVAFAPPAVARADAPVAGESVVPDGMPPRENIALGLLVYGHNGCATCHSVSGEGNPRYPLDGCGDRWAADELRAWVIGTGVATETLSEGVRRRKARYQQQPAEDLDSLVAYLATLKQRER